MHSRHHLAVWLLHGTLSRVTWEKLAQSAVKLELNFSQLVIPANTNSLQWVL